MPDSYNEWDVVPVVIDDQPTKRVLCAKCEIVFDPYCPDCTYEASDAARRG